MTTITARFVSRNRTMRFMAMIDPHAGPLPGGEAASEGNVVLEIVELAAALGRGLGCARARTGASAAAGGAGRIRLAHVAAAAALARAQHLHAVRHDLGGVLVRAILV